jgi:DedD protein
MGLLSSLFKRNTAAPAAKPVSESASDVQQLRVRARRRLIGAAVLVGLGVIGFPLVFETQPRPIPVDLPIDIPRKEGAAPLSIPPAANSTAAAPPPVVLHEPATPSPAPRAEAKPEPREEILPNRPLAQAPVAEARPEPKVEPKPAAKPASKPETKQETKPEPRKEPVAATQQAAAKQEAARVQALLEGKKPEPASAAGAAGAGRFIVQVGAYADSKSAQEARMKVERLGLKTYTQAVETPDGKRIRVRVGPFANREEADKAAAKVRGGGLSTAVLSL